MAWLPALAACSLLFPISDDAARGSAPAAPSADASSDVEGADAVADADGSTAPEGGCGAQLEIDPENCGECGRSCRGAGCRDRRCESKQLTGGVFPAAIALGSEYVYFAEEKTYGHWVTFCQKTGCSNPQSLALDQPAIPSIVTSANHLIWGDADGGLIKYVLVERLDGGPLLAPERARSDLPSVSGLALHDSTLLIAERAIAGNIRRCSADDLASCGDGGSAPVAAGQVMIRDLAIEPSGQRVYRITKANGGSIVASNVSPPSQGTSVVEQQPDATSLAVDDAYVYWTTGVPNGAVLRAPKTGLAAGENPTVLAADQATPWAIAIDETNVYFTTLGAGAEVDAGGALGTVARVPKAGGAVLTLAIELRRPWRVAVDDQFVYWTSRGYVADEGSVMRVAK